MNGSSIREPADMINGAVDVNKLRKVVANKRSMQMLCVVTNLWVVNKSTRDIIVKNVCVFQM